MIAFQMEYGLDKLLLHCDCRDSWRKTKERGTSGDGGRWLEKSSVICQEVCKKYF